MDPFSSLLLLAAVVVIALWAMLSLYVLNVQRRREATRAILSSAIAALRQDDVKRLPAGERAAKVRLLLEGASRDLVMSAAAATETPDAVFEPLTQHLVERWGLDGLVSNASAHRSPRDKWRRITALRILFRMNYSESLDFLGKAIAEPDEDVAAAAFTLLGRSTEPRAMDLLFHALTAKHHPASRVAAYIEHSAQEVSDRLRGLLSHPDPVMRLWGATLLASYPDEPVEDELAALTIDADPRVRKAAIQSLGKVGDERAAESAVRLLKDPYPYVRAHAARALGELDRSDLADEIALLLGDGNWWVRLAAKESLEMLGSDVWPVVMRQLNHSDKFTRNGAAEVAQNLGVLDSLIVMEAASDNPAPTKIAMLKRIADAGGIQFTDSLVERAGPIIGPRIRGLLATIGLEHVEAH